MSHIQISHDGEQYDIPVDDTSKLDRIRYAAKAPDELHKMADDPPDDPAQMDRHFNEEVLDFLIEVTVDNTNFTEDMLEDMPMEATLELTTAVLDEVFDDSAQDDEKRRVRRVRVTKQFIEVLFRGDAAVVAGMPDDAEFDDFHYDPSRQELQFIFHSEEWEPVAEAAQIPVHQATVAEVEGNGREL